MNQENVNKSAKMFFNEIINKLNGAAGDELDALDESLKKLYSAKENFMNADEKNKADFLSDYNYIAVKTEKCAFDAFVKLEPVFKKYVDEKCAFLREYLLALRQALMLVYSLPRYNTCSPTEFIELTNIDLKLEVTNYIAENVKAGALVYQARQQIKQNNADENE